MCIEIIKKYCQKADVNLCHLMPEGYETAYGTFNVYNNTIYLNIELLKPNDEWEYMFYFFHELRHAMQYKKMDNFSNDIIESIKYVILYNGKCYRLGENRWLECQLDGTEEYFTSIYLNLPYELEANAWALEKCLIYYPKKRKELKRLFSLFVPKQRITFAKYKEIFLKIDELAK